MTRSSFCIRFISIGFILIVPSVLWGEALNIAVASNFFNPMKTLSRHFQETTQHTLVLISGSTGKHYAQIKNGAPFDLFFAADTHHPERLEREGLGISGSRFTYARGRLVLWSPKAGYVDSEGNLLTRGDFRHLAIANPKTAPYGKAAQEVLENRGVWHLLRERLVQGESIAQAFQFVRTGAAELGFIAFSQISGPGGIEIEGSYWEVPQSAYTAILQDAVLLKESPAARAFLDFIQGNDARGIIRTYGYETP